MTKRTLEALMKQSGLALGLLLVSGLFILTQLTDAASAAHRGGGRVEGIVTTAETGAPLAGVDVWLDRVTEHDPSPRLRAQTDENGWFVFDRVHPGRYWLDARKTGYVPPHDGQQLNDTSPEYLNIKAGAVISDIHIRLRLGAVVSGTVLDETGQPASGLEVKLLTLDASNQPLTGASAGSIGADEAGQYQLVGVPAGRYVLRAERHRQGSAQAELEVVYYPGVESPLAAMPIEISSAEVLTGMDMTFSPVREASVITGAIADARTRALLASVNVVLANGLMSLQTKTAADGRFRFEGVSPGQYTILVHAAGVGDGYESKVEKTTVTAGRNVVDFELSPAPLVAATVEYIGLGPAPARGDYMISVRVDRNTRGITYNGQESFEFRGLPAGTARIGVGFAALQYRLAAVLVGDQDMTGQTFDLHPGDKLTDVRILITDDHTVDRALEINP